MFDDNVPYHLLFVHYYYIMTVKKSRQNVINIIFNMLLIIHCLYIHNAFSFYLPGVAPRDFKDGDVVDLKVNSITSFMTKLPYKYYSLKFPTSKNSIALSTILNVY